MGLGAWLGAMMAPLAARILMALGFSVVSVVGVGTALAQIKGLLISNLMGVPAAGLQLALLAGAGQALGILLGAVATRVALWQIQNATKILGVSS